MHDCVCVLELHREHGIGVLKCRIVDRNKMRTMARASFLLTHRAYCEWEGVESEREGEGGAGEEGEDKGTKRVGRREEKGKRC